MRGVVMLLYLNGSSGEVYNYQKPVSQGGGQGHSHAIPYIAVSVWRRTA